MTTHDELPSGPEVEATQAEAEQAAKRFADLLGALGWQLVVVSVGRRVDAGGRCSAPGSTALYLEPGPMGHALPTTADALEQLARQLREVGGMKEWPR